MRTFVAIELPHAIQEQVHSAQVILQRLLRTPQSTDPFNWTPVTKVHITLRFLGETDTRQQRLLNAGLMQIAAQQPLFSLQLAGVGCFPNYQAPRIVWLGLAGELPRLTQLQTPIEELAQQAGFAPEKLVFSPHLTIARSRRTASLAELGQAGASLRSVPARAAPEGQLPHFSAFAVEQIVYLQSELLPDGARYTPLRTFRLQNAS